MTEVRAAVPEDRAGILDLCRELYAENAQHEANWPKIEAMVDRGILKAQAAIGVIGPIGEPHGAVLMLLDPVWYSDEFQLLELFNFVHADHRRSDYARSLIVYAKQMADATGLDLTIGVLSNHRMEAKLKLYGRLLPKGGEFYVYRPTAENETISIAAE